MGAVISFFRPAPTTQGDWSQQELAEFYRVEAALIRAGMRITSEQGLSDEAEPWFVFCQPDGEAIMHFARIDGSYVVASEALDHPMHGSDFRSLLNQIAAQYPVLLPIPKAEAGTKLLVHPAALLAAIVAGAALSLSHEDALASEFEYIGSDGPVPSTPTAGSGQVAPVVAPLPSKSRSSGEAHEQCDHRRQIEAIVFSAMLFAAQAVAADGFELKSDPELLLTEQTSTSRDHLAQSDVSLPSIPAAGSGRAEGPTTQLASALIPGAEGQGRKDAAPLGAGEISTIQQSRPDVGFEGAELLSPEVKAAGASHSHADDAAPGRSKNQSEIVDASEVVKSTGPDNHGSDGHGPKADASPTTPGEVSPEVKAAGASHSHADDAAPGRSKNQSEIVDASEVVKSTGPDNHGSDGHGPKADASPTTPGEVSPEVKAAGASHSHADDAAPGRSKNQSEIVDASEVVKSTGPDNHGSDGHGPKADASPTTPGEVSPEVKAAGASHSHADDAAPGRSKNQSEIVDASEVVKSTGPDNHGSDGHGPKADASPTTPGEVSPEVKAAGASHSHADDAAPGRSKNQSEIVDASEVVKSTGPDNHGSDGHGPKADASPTTPGEVSPEIKAAGASHSHADNTRSSAEHGTAAAANLAHPAASSQPTDATGSSSPVQPGGVTPPPASTTTAQDSQPSHVARTNAQMGLMTAEVDAGGNLVFASGNGHQSPPAPSHAPQDADMHTDVGLVGLSHHHASLHYPDLH